MVLMKSGTTNHLGNTEITLAKPYHSDGGHCYTANLETGQWAHELTRLGDNNENQRQSPAILLEDGRPIGPAHASHSDVRNRGRGSFSHWSSALYFSASDNTDPNENGRTYTLRINRDLAREQRLATVMVEFLRSRLAELGPTESGFYDYYSRLAETGTPFQAYDRAIVRFILDRALGYKKYVEIDPKFIRPAEVDLLLGDSSKTKKTLGWKHSVDFKGLVRLMVDADLHLHRVLRRGQWLT